MMKRIDLRDLSCFGSHGSHVGVAVRLILSFLFALFLLARVANAQDHVWSQLIGGPGSNNGIAVATDGSGNVFLGGEFDSSITVGGASVSTSPFSTDAYVAKFSSSGDAEWIIQIGGAGDDTLQALAVDNAGNVAVVGAMSSGAVFLTLLDGQDGTVVWSRNFSGGGFTIASGVAVDSGGNVILAAGFQGSVDFGGGPLTSAGSYDLALASYNSANGSHRWSRRFGGTGDDLADTVAIGTNDVIAVAGNFSATTDLGTGPHTTNGLSDIFVATYAASNGAPLWSKAVGGTGFDAAHGVAVDAQGNALVTGYFGLFGGPVNFGAGAVASTGGADAFLVKYGPSGAHQWSRTFGGLGDDYGNGIAVDSAGSPTVTGSFQLTVDFGGGPRTGAGQIDIFVAHYTDTGQHDWSQAYGSIVTDKGLAVATDPDNQILATGFAQWNVNFGGGTLINAGFADGYLLKLSSDEPAPTATPTPTPTPQGTPSGNCPAAPDPACVTGFQKGMLLVRGVPGKEKLVAKMLKGPALEQTDVGNPLDATRGGSGTSFTLCVYGQSQNLVGELTVDRAGDVCAAGGPCWKSIGKAPNDPNGPGKGYNYTDKGLAADGVLKLMYRGGNEGKSKVLLKAKGANLPSSIAQQIQGSSQATAQLSSSDGVCLSLTLSGGDRLFNRVN